MTYSQRLSLVEKNDELPFTQQAKLLSVSRSSFYYKPDVSDKQLEIMHEIDKIYTEFPCYGARRIAKALQRKWYQVWRKLAVKYMQLMWFKAQYPKPNTSKWNPEHKIYPYLLRWYEVSEANEVWSTDITYIRMPHWWVYLVAVIDWYSRKILSWRLSPTLELDFCIDCLKEALSYWKPKIFNTDQWSQFTSNQFVWVLLDQWVQVSMDGKWRAIDNIYIERFWRTLKQEEVYVNEYDTPIEAQVSIWLWIKKYNSRRLHQSLDYDTPNEKHEESLKKKETSQLSSIITNTYWEMSLS